MAHDNPSGWISGSWNDWESPSETDPAETAPAETAPAETARWESPFENTPGKAAPGTPTWWNTPAKAAPPLGPASFSPAPEAATLVGDYVDWKTAKKGWYSQWTEGEWDAWERQRVMYRLRRDESIPPPLEISTGASSWEPAPADETSQSSWGTQGPLPFRARPMEEDGERPDKRARRE